MAGAQNRRAKVERRNPGGESTHSDSRSGSASQSHSSASPKIGTNFDGNRDPEQPARNVGALAVVPTSGGTDISPAMKNMDLGAAAFDMVRGHKVVLDARKPPSKLGKEISLALNTFAVTIPQTRVVQYSVQVGSGGEKRGLITKCWESNAVRKALPDAHSWLFDGNTLAWCKEPRGKKVQKGEEYRIQVDLDAEQGKTGRAGKSNVHRVVVKQTTYVDFASLMAYLAGRADFTNEVLEAVTFMDHLMRETPRQKYTSIKRAFFAKGLHRHELGGGIEAFKGVYQSLRIAHSPAGASLTCNVDVANGTFFTGGDIKYVVVKLVGLRNEAEIGLLNKAGTTATMAKKFQELRRLRKLHVMTMHRGPNLIDDYVIDRFLTTSAVNHKIKIKDEDNVEKTLTLQQYFHTRYNIRLRYPDWPVVQMTKKAILPLELLRLKENQRFQYKLDERQTANMIKLAVTAPRERWGDIEHGLDMVQWSEDPRLKLYEMQISRQPTTVKARLLQNPKLVFGGNSIQDPRTSGRWDLKGKKFFSPNPAPLQSWGVCIVTGRFTYNQSDVDRFVGELSKAYKLHGGRIDVAPVIVSSPNADPGVCVAKAWNDTGNKFQKRPQILCFILPDKDPIVYGRIKRSCECRYGVVSQCMQIAHVAKAQPQYISNVLMKFNAKLGGVTNRAVGATSSGANGIFKVPTCIIGADVSHAAPGSQVASMAALTVSLDKLATRYAAACETNGYRVEMITPDNMQKLLKPLLKTWVQTVGCGFFPKRIIYFRDGVSEGQFAHVLQQEVPAIKSMLKAVLPTYDTKFIVIIASKRHHIRFFPKSNDHSAADRNGNPLPGTLVETGVTHPFENDFYLCSHAAIKGTARPVHYSVLLNEAGVSNDELQTMIYEHSYQYIRATTPVSLFPAVYYAHLASNRALHHDKNFGGSNAAERIAKAKASALDPTSSTGTLQDYDPLMIMPDQAEISKSMWYV